MGSMVSSIKNHHSPSKRLLEGSKPEAFKPVLLSALVKWCERVQKDAGQVWHRGCKKSLENEDLWRQEMEDGCPFCTLLYEAVWKLYGDYLAEGRALKWTVPYPRTIEAIRDDGGNSVCFSVPDDGNLVLRLQGFPNLWRPKGPAGYLKPILRNTASEQTLQVVRDWINDCTSTHPLCYKAGIARLPTRVIDVGPGEDGICLRETGQSKGVYACLSHPWGKTPLVRTLKDNISQFKSEIPWSKLPRTFQDAIDFTRRLGLQYIWIDSLCIIQDDPLDWQKEAAQMAHIYQYAYVTLAASKATDSSRGLYTSSLDPKEEAQQLSLVNDVDDTNFPLQACSNILHVDDFLDFFPIFRRAWVYQERLLSARVVHFAGAEVNWECNSAKDCECGKLSSESVILPEKIHFAGSLADLNGRLKGKYRELPGGTSDTTDTTHNYSKFSTTLLQSPQWGQSVKAWRQAVKQYAQLNLTFAKDTFPALAGIAKMWSPQNQDQYIAGLWRHSIHLDLLWLVYKPGQRSGQWRSPTWSWASLDYENEVLLRFDSDSDCLNSGKGSWLSLGKIGTEDYAPVAEVLEAVCVPAGIDPTGELSSAHLLLSTYALQGTLVKWPEVFVEYSWNPIWLVIGDTWIIQGSTHTRGFQLDAPILDTTGPWSMPVQIIRITDFGLQTGKCPEMACLVIREKGSAMAGEAEYERIGYVRFVEHGFSEGFTISAEHINSEPSMRSWATRYQRDVREIRAREGDGEKAILERLMNWFHEGGRQTFKLV